MSANLFKFLLMKVIKGGSMSLDVGEVILFVVAFYFLLKKEKIT